METFRVRAKALLALVVACGAVGAIALRAPGAAPSGAAAPGATLEALERDIQNLHNQMGKSLVRVSIVQSAASVLPPDLRVEFDRWTPTQAPGGAGGGGGGGGGRRGGGEGSRGGMGDRGQTRPDYMGPGFGSGGGGGGGGGGFGGGRGGPGGPGGGVSQRVQSFIAERIRTKSNSTSLTDRAEVERLRALALRIELSRGVFQGEMSAAVLDDQGHALILTGLMREAHTGANPPMRATLPDGTATTAAYIGANLYGNFTVLKLENWKGTTPVRWAPRKVAPGQLLMTTTAGPGNGALIVATRKPGETPSEDRISLPAEDRSGMFVQDIRGSLVAVMPAGGGLGGERYATTAARMQRQIAYITTQKKDIEPQPLGLRFSTQERKVLVDEIASGSLADAAKLKRGDTLVSIDGHPISELVAGNRETPGMLQLKADLITRKGAVPLVVLRDGKEVALTMPLP
jgi:S1-C subfamily serine protease